MSTRRTEALRALAERGTPAEQENAQKLLDQQKEREGIAKRFTGWDEAEINRLGMIIDFYG